MKAQAERRVGKLRSSITIRLNLRLFFRMLLFFLVIDGILLLIFYGYYHRILDGAGIAFTALLQAVFQNGSFVIAVLDQGVFLPLSMGVYVLLAVELVTLLSGLFRNSGIIRKSLRPIEELADTAERLNSVTSMSDEELSALVGELDKIDVDGLSTRIKLDGTQKELQTLAYAINNLLERVSKSYEAQARFVSDASHELRTPISVIQGYADLLHRWGKDDPETLNESIDAIRAETANMKEILEELLFLARGDNNSTQLEPEEFDACEMAKEIVREYEMIDSEHVYLLDMPEQVMIYADPGLIKQAMRILIDNAMKYSQPGGRILFAVQDCGREFRLSVEDEGQGISADDLPHVFDRFYRTDESRARQTGGSGLGLSIAKWIVDRHSGYFEIVSRVDVGTRFTIVLPAKKRI